MRFTRLQLLTGILLALLLLIALWAYGTKTNAPTFGPAESVPVQTETKESEPAERTAIAVGTTGPTTAARSVAVQGTALLSVEGTMYALTAPEGSTLKEAMDQLDHESDFSYRYRNYAGLGAFVTQINGRASKGDMVWIFSVNGKKSATGISSTRIRSGDVIEWKLEKSY